MSREKPMTFSEAVRLAAGVHAHVPKPNPNDRLGAALRAAHAGDQAKGSALRRRFMERLHLLKDDEPTG
ncbi:MAG: hypothetical protein H3C30_16215 [Candidatus Hydrogenedentes bacterium]|nr:hypothetical protein [Candidatus Hydrogenedentota bacterium]